MFKFFNCRHPIVAVAMNSVSDLNLALACFDAGIIPSLSFFNYYYDDTQLTGYDVSRFEQDIKKFVEHARCTELIISMSANHLFDRKVQDIIKNYNLSYIELVQNVNPSTFDMIKQIKKELGFKLLIKCLYDTPLMKCDAIVLKGPLGAGRSNPDGDSLKKLVKSVRNSYPNLTIIASGGISNKDDIQEILNEGADLVGIGTLFAASLESPISNETKEKIITSNRQDLTRIGKFKQQGLFFGAIDEKDNANNSRGLNTGIKNPADGGHVFLGTAVDEITEILTVDEIVKKLTE